MTEEDATMNCWDEILKALRERAQSLMESSNAKGPQWQRKAYAHAFAGVCQAIRIVEDLRLEAEGSAQATESARKDGAS